MHDAALQVVHFLNARAASFPTGLAGVPDHECLNLFVDDLVSKTALDEAMLRLKCWYGGFFPMARRALDRTTEPTGKTSRSPSLPAAAHAPVVPDVKHNVTNRKR